MFDSRDCQTAIATVVSNTRVLLLVNTTYTTENKHLLGIYAVVNQVNLCSKEMIHMFVTLGGLVSIFSRGLNELNPSNLR